MTPISYAAAYLPLRKWITLKQTRTLSLTILDYSKKSTRSATAHTSFILTPLVRMLKERI